MKVTLKDILGRIEDKKLVPVKIGPPGGQLTLDGPVVFTAYCSSCKHRQGPGFCSAYPEGIPLSIALGITNHLKPVAGDRGIRFDPVEGSDEKEVLSALRTDEKGLENAAKNLQYLEDSKSVMPARYPGFVGQIVRGDSLDRNTFIDAQLETPLELFHRYADELNGAKK